MTLTDYIKQVGVPAFSRAFDIKERTVIAYRYGVRRPRPEVAMRIIEKTPVTWEGIYGAESRAS